LKQLKSCYKNYNAQGASNTWDNNLGKVRFDINDIVESFVFEGTEDDLAEIPEVLKSLNELWQESTNQGVLVSERSKKKIEGKAKVMGQGQESRAAAGQGAPASQMLQPPSPRAAADGRENFDLPAREGQVSSPAIDAGGNGKGKEKAAEGDGEEEEVVVADSEEEGVQKSGSMRKHVAGASESGKSKGSVVRPRTGSGKRGAGGGQSGSKDEFETVCWDCKRGDFAQKHRTHWQCRREARHTACDWRKDPRELDRKRDKEEETGQGAPASQMLQPPSPRAAADGREKADLPAQVNEGQVPGAGMMRVLEGRAEAVAGTMNAQDVANNAQDVANTQHELVGKSVNMLFDDGEWYLGNV